nr:glycoside hydrolase family 95 protein [Candidatus Sigynarchaeota archaeon]
NQPPTERGKSNENLLLDAYNGNVPAVLVERMFYLGRYLLVCSSRPGGWPANLQGVWNGYYFPPWSSDYHNDENIQMNYWAALPGNLAETTLPYFDFYESCLEDYRRNARVIYGCRGILAPIAQTVKGKAPLYGGPWLNWISGAGWLSQLFFDYWLFTRDDAFLRDHVVPFLIEVARFYEDFLVEDGSGTLVFSPSLSPENVPDIPDGSLATVNATMDVAVAKEVLSNLCKACTRLGIESESIHKWSAMAGKLPEYQVNADGAMREWLDARLPDNYHHRHIAHIYPLFPGFEVTRETNPAIFEACRVAVDKRLVVGQESQSGWSLAHQASIWARLGQGDRALGCIETVIRSCVGENLFTYHNDWRHMGLTLYWDFIDKLFQIDANFGIVAAVLEMLVFSNENMVKILPARPTVWKRGSVSGIACRCGIKVGFSWNVEGRSLDVSIEPSITAEITIMFPSTIETIEVTPQNAYVNPSPLGGNYRGISVKLGEALAFHVVLDFQHYT